jgi:hypothetical protein
MKRVVWLSVAWAATASPFAFAQDSGLQKCRAITEPAQRLACYDALPVATPAPPAAPARSPLARFGFEDRPQGDELASAQSHVAGRYDGWGPRSLIRLANGQVWEVIDGSSGWVGATNPKVTIRRGVMDSFFLEFEGLNASPRVRRIQ